MSRERNDIRGILIAKRKIGLSAGILSPREAKSYENRRTAGPGLEGYAEIHEPH
ncbi:MAG: hypothetical protein QXH51_06500 [Candidatus Bathyarchaeia archaeon]